MRPIDADALLKELNKRRYDQESPSLILTPAGQEIYNSGIDAAWFAVTGSKTIDAVPVVHARWIHCKGKSNLWYCSNCGDKMIYNPTRRTYNIVKLSMAEKNKFCRNCGARMDGEADG